MNKLLYVISILLVVSCNSNSQEPVSNDYGVKELKQVLAEPYEIDLEIEKLTGNDYSLSITIDLENGNFIVSPFSEDTVYGHFDVSIMDSDHLIISDSITEIPGSVEEFDSILEQTVKFVRVKTTYKKIIKVNTKEDFEIRGMIWFLLEPCCTPEEVNFTISYQSGKMNIKR